MGLFVTPDDALRHSLRLLTWLSCVCRHISTTYRGRDREKEKDRERDKDMRCIDCNARTHTLNLKPLDATGK